MLSICASLLHQHDLRLLLLAVLVCVSASGTAMSRLAAARANNGAAQRVHLLIASVVTGFGMWSTHFIALLAFDPGIPTGYDVGGTVLSLLAAIVMTQLAFMLTVGPKVPQARLVGGVTLGFAVGTMQFLSIATLRVAGHLVWDVSGVVAALLLGSLFCYGALIALFNARPRYAVGLGTLLLTLGIWVVHFAAAPAVGIVPDAHVIVQGAVRGRDWLAGFVGLASLAVLLLHSVALLIAGRSQQNAQRRFRELANAAVEGLVVCEDGIIATANENFARLIGAAETALVGRPFLDLVVDRDEFSELSQKGENRMEVALRASSGEAIPVELFTRPIEGSGRHQQGVAVRDLRDRKRAEAQIRFLAHHDPLTGLANRMSFNERLSREIRNQRRSSSSFALLCVDLDRFKEINDVFGHSAGDRVLQTVALRVSALLDADDLFARLGGDEFAIIRLAPHRVEDLQELCEGILAAVAEGIDIGGQTALVGVSIGAAVFPEHGETETALINYADAALYRAKLEGRNTFRIFEADIGSELHDRRVLDQDLRLALGRGELSLVYQPQTIIETGRICGFEVLLRWHHPTRGNVPPSTFIPIAEETGQIVPIGEWVLRTACAEAATWSQPVSLSVNVSAIQLYAADLPNVIAEVLEQTGLAPERLELEVTETAMVRDTGRAVQVLNEIRQLGVRLALDDFGTAYSSLANLQTFPFDRIKIDCSFVRNVHQDAQSAAIVRAILGLGRGLNLTVIAEGVETREELEFLAREQCAEAQGYYFSRPAASRKFWDEQGNLVLDPPATIPARSRPRIVAA